MSGKFVEFCQKWSPYKHWFLKIGWRWAGILTLRNCTSVKKGARTFDKWIASLEKYYGADISTFARVVQANRKTNCVHVYAVLHMSIKEGTTEPWASCWREVAGHMPGPARIHRCDGEADSAQVRKVLDEILDYEKCDVQFVTRGLRL